MKTSDIVLIGGLAVGGFLAYKYISSRPAQSSSLSGAQPPQQSNSDGGYGSDLSQLFGFLGGFGNNFGSTNSTSDPGNGNSTGTGDFDAFGGSGSNSGAGNIDAGGSASYPSIGGLFGGSEDDSDTGDESGLSSAFGGSGDNGIASGDDD